MIDAMVVPKTLSKWVFKAYAADEGRLVRDDQATLKAMLPKLGDKEGDIFDTGPSSFCRP